MRVVRADSGQVGAVRFIERQLVHVLFDAAVVLLLEDLAVAHRELVPVLVVGAIAGDFVDEEEREALDAAREERLLLLEVTPDGLADLHAAHVVLSGVAVDLALVDDLAVKEAHAGGLPLHVRNDAVGGDYEVAVGLEPGLTACLVEGVSHIEASNDLAHRPISGEALVFYHSNGRFTVAYQHVLQVEIAVGAAHVLELEALHLDALHQALVVGVERVQLVDQVVEGLALLVPGDGGGVREREERVEAPHALLCRLAAHLLGLVLDDDGMRRRDHVDGAARLEVVLRLEDLARVLVTGALLHGGVERLHVDDHAANAVVLGKSVELH